ncbi:MAG: hypothetical protein ACT4O0_19680 [Pseudonocardia sp.]
MSEHGHAGAAAESGPPSRVRVAEEKAEDVLGEAGRQARDLLGEAQEQLRAQTETAQHQAAQSLSALAGELSLMAQRSKQTGLATDLVRQAGERVEDASRWLDRRAPAELVEEARAFARRRPGTFLLGAALLGAAAGRLTRGLTSSPGQGEQSPSHSAEAARVEADAASEPSPERGLDPPDGAEVRVGRASVTVGEYVQDLERRTGSPLTAETSPAATSSAAPTSAAGAPAAEAERS